MSRISRYSFDTTKSKYDAVNCQEHFPQDEPLENQVARNENEINDIVQKCTKNELGWRNVKLLYRGFELAIILCSLIISVTSVVLAAVFFTQYKAAFKYIKQVGKIQFKLTTHLPLYYLIAESIGLIFDLIRALVSSRVFRVFVAESRDQKALYSKNNQGTNDYMLILSENSITIKTINDLRQRVNVKTELKKMFRSLIRIEILINLYFYVFVIVPKILAASFIQINLMGEFPDNYTGEFRINSIEMNNSYVSDFKCFYDKTSNTTDYINKILSECVHNSVGYFLQLLSIIFLVTAVLKFFVQLLLAANLKLNLMDNLVQKRYVEEINMKRMYDHNRSASFSHHIQSRIEQNDEIMAEQIRMLNNKDPDLVAIKEQPEEFHYYAEIGT